MKRFKLILAVAATMAAIMAFSAAPAMAAPEDRFFDDGFLFFDCDDFEFDDVGSDIDVSPESSFESNQRVNQSATASKR